MGAAAGVRHDGGRLMRNWGRSMAIVQRVVGPGAAARPQQGWGAIRPMSEGTEVLAATPAPLRIAYLTNLYPAVSHSFIRTEIEALERVGFAIERFSVRRSSSLSDEADRIEASRTRVLLGGWSGLMTTVGRHMLANPLRAIGTLIAAIRGACRRGVRAGSLLRAGAYFAEAVILSDAMRRAGIGHVHAHFGTNPASVARLAAKLAGMRYSFTVHGPDEFDAPVEIDLAGKIADAAFVVAVSSFGRSQLMRWSDPAHWNRIAVVPCSVAPRFLDAAPGATDPRRLVCVARLSAQKGLPLLIEAIGRLNDEAPFRIDIIGDGDQRSAIEARIAELGIEDRVRLFGWCAPERVVREVATARAFVLPSFAEGLPVGIMEAMALGRPVIATAIAGIPELVDADTGWLIPAGSVEALAAAIRAALNASKARLDAMGAVGRARVLVGHHPDTNAATLAALLERHF